MAGNYDPNKDYAAAIKKETDPGKKQQLISERQNKIDAMNAAGTNTNNYSNSIYNGGGNTSGNSGSGSNKNNSSGNKNSGGYYDPNKDYAAAIKNATTEAERNQLIAERENKINAMNAAGTNTGGYSNDIYNKPSKESYGYFDSGKDYAAAINAETDPVKKAQLIQERQNKLDWMNASGQNQNGYSNSIYGGNATSFGGQEDAAKGIYQSQDAMINNTQLNADQMQALKNAAIADMQGDDVNMVPVENPLAGTNYEQALNLVTDPAQKAALQAYFTRMQSDIDPSEVAGTYKGDTSMSLPDQALIAQYQAVYNQAKERGDTAGMEAAHKMAEKVRDNYRYYPLANSNGYGLGENDIGWIRDIVVRVDGNGNKYIDQYNRDTVTVQRINADGTPSWKLTGTDAARHDDRIAKDWERAEEYGNDYMAFRVADPNDVNLSVPELVAKYGVQNGMGKELYTTNRINSKIDNGKTLADVYREQGISGYGGNGAQNANSMALGANAGQADIFSIYGYFDPNKDYAAAIQAATSQAEREALMAERQNKINYLNGTGQNTGGYTNAIYGQQVQQPMMQEMLPEYVGMTQEEIQEQYGDIAEQLEAQRLAYLQQTQAQLNAAQSQAGQEYDDIARQAYILKRQQEVAMPQQLAAMGISGGGSETANLKLQTNYQNNLNQNELARQQMLKDYAMQNLAAQTQANSDIAGYFADAQQNAMNAWQNEMANQNSWNQWAANYQQGLREYGDQLNNLTYEQLQANKQQQIDLALQLGDYDKLKALGYDTSYVQRLQDAELEQLALAAAKARSSNSSSGGRSGGSSGGSSGGKVTTEADVVLGNNDSALTPNGYTFLVMNYKALGDTEAFEQKVNELMNNGSVSRADYEKFLKAYS